MDELRVVSKKQSKKGTNVALTTLLSHDLAENFFNPLVFNCREQGSIRAHAGEIFQLLIIGEQLFSASYDQTIKVWNLQNGKHLRTLEGHRGSIWALVHKDEQLISAGADRTIRFWDLQSGKLLCTILAHLNQIYALAVNEQNRLVTSSLDKTVKIWDLENKKLLKVISTEASSIWSLALTNTKIIGGAGDGTLKLWSIRNGSLLKEIKAHDDNITTVLVQQNYLLTASRDKLIKIWDLDNLELLHTLEGHRNTVWDLSLFYGSIASVSEDRNIKIWNLFSGELLDSFKAHNDWISAVAMNNSKLVSACSDGTIKFWLKEPKHNCASLNLQQTQSAPKSPFETEAEYQEKIKQSKQQLYERLISYDYINIGKVELLTAAYDNDKKVLPVKVQFLCPKLSELVSFSENFMSVLQVEPYMAGELHHYAQIYSLYIRFYLKNHKLGHELCIIFNSQKFILDLKFRLDEAQIRKTELMKTGRINVKLAVPLVEQITLQEPPRHNCQSIRTADTFRLPFETELDFEQRLRQKLMDYGDIHIGQIDLNAEEYNLEMELFPLRAKVSCDKVLNLTEIQAAFEAAIKISRQAARNLYESSSQQGLYIRFFEKAGGFYYELSLIFQSIKYFLI